MRSFGDPNEQDKISAESFDNMVSFNCLEHIPKGTAPAWDTARPGGCVLISTCAARVAGKWWEKWSRIMYLISSGRSLEPLGRQGD
jgi:2-polyprenyl-3-methyl-5-hydroxy-6-metoxy-1,4-benzoquinol methylase